MEELSTLNVEGISTILEQSHWIVQIFIVSLFALTIDLLQRRTLNKLIVRAEKNTKNLWDEAILRAMRRPISLIIWITSIAFSAKIAQSASPAMIFEAIDPLRRSEEHTSELQSRPHLVCRLLLEKKK